jgi:hypothetical protein
MFTFLQPFPLGRCFVHLHQIQVFKYYLLYHPYHITVINILCISVDSFYTARYLVSPRHVRNVLFLFLSILQRDNILIRVLKAIAQIDLRI